MRVGVSVGTSVGDAVVGEGEGTAVGSAVGTIVGFNVGALVGDAVGTLQEKKGGEGGGVIQSPAWWQRFNHTGWEVASARRSGRVRG